MPEVLQYLMEQSDEQFKRQIQYILEQLNSGGETCQMRVDLSKFAESVGTTDRGQSLVVGGECFARLSPLNFGWGKKLPEPQLTARTWMLAVQLARDEGGMVTQQDATLNRLFTQVERSPNLGGEVCVWGGGRGRRK